MFKVDSSLMPASDTCSACAAVVVSSRNLARKSESVTAFISSLLISTLAILPSLRFPAQNLLDISRIGALLGPSNNTCDYVCEEPGECRLTRHPRYRCQAPPEL